GQDALLFPNMRWAKMQITIFVDADSCSSGTIDDLKAAAQTWQTDTDGIVSFSFINSSVSAQVTVQCSSELSRQKEGRIIIETVGETRPRVINTGLYNLTVDAEVAFLTRSVKCVQPVVHMHELGHVLGLGHDDDMKSIMYAYEECDQQVTPKIVSTVKELYNDPPLADLYFKNITASRKGTYANFNITIYNQGLVDSPTTTAAIMKGSDEIYKISINGLKPGSGWFFAISNVRVGADTGNSNLSVAIDPKNEVSEIDERNNIVHLVEQ
ncbi:MAG TPA: CARDB domain-containing protein, partial [archaeon]|nr:CARDB domain-containing protein [archaeon]